MSWDKFLSLAMSWSYRRSDGGRWPLITVSAIGLLGIYLEGTSLSPLHKKTSSRLHTSKTKSCLRELCLVFTLFHINLKTMESQKIWSSELKWSRHLPSINCSVVPCSECLCPQGRVTGLTLILDGCFLISVTVMPNTHRRRNSTRQLSCVGVGGVYWALGYFWDNGCRSLPQERCFISSVKQLLAARVSEINSCM